MPKQQIPHIQSHIRHPFLYLLRRLWIIGLIVTFGINLIAIGYVMLRGTELIDDAQIRAETNAYITTQDPIIIRFTTPMLQSTVVDALQITPTHPYQISWTDDSQQLTIMPDSPWLNATTYTVRILTNAQSRTGRYLQQEWDAQVNTQRIVQIRQVLPTPNQADVARDSMIVVRFGQQMVTQSVVGSELDQSQLQILPPIDGISKWLDSRTLAFQPSTLMPNQEYAITVPAQLTDVTGTPLQSSYTWRFRTMATRIERIYPASGSQEVDIQQSLVLTMTGQIDAVRLQQSLSITPTIDTQISITPLTRNQTRVDVMPIRGWQSETNYAVTLGGGDSDLAAFSTTFRTAPALRLVARTPGEGEAVGNDREVRFIFNTLLDTSTITDAITITPPPIQPARISTTGRDIRIVANWEVQVNPIIQISSALQSSNGISLTTPISSELRIDPRQALVTLPGVPGEIYDASASSTFQLQIIPNRTAMLRIYDLPVATLVRMLDMDVTTFLDIDPVRYNLPLLTQKELQSSDNRPQISVDIMQNITGTPISRILLAQLISANGSQDIRLIRTQPATIHAVSIPQHIAIGIQDQQVPQSNRSILIFQSGQLITQGQTDARGLWYTKTYNPNQRLVVIDPQQPIDAQTLNTRPVADDSELQLIVDRESVARGDTLNLIMSRQQSDYVQISTVQVRHTTGELVYEQQVAFDVDVRMTSAQIRIPNQVAPGIYTIEWALAGRVMQKTILVYGPLSHTTTITSEIRNNIQYLIIHDKYGQSLPNQSVYWVNNNQYGSAMSNQRGEVVVPIPTQPTTVLAETASGSTIYQILPEQEGQRITFTHANWFDIDQPLLINIQLFDALQTVDNRIVQIDVQNNAQQISQRQQVVTNADGTATVTLALTKGQWQLTATADTLKASTTLWVGMSQHDELFEHESNELTLTQTPRWRNNQSTVEQVLIAQSINQQIRIEWTQSDEAGIITSEPISQTGTLRSGISTAGQPYHHTEQRVGNPQCPTNAQLTATAQNQLLTIQIGYLPNSDFLFNVYDITGQKLLTERINMRSDENGIIELQLEDDGIMRFVQLSLIVMNDDCQLAVTQTIPVERAQLLTLDAPMVVRIGDVVGVKLIIQDSQPSQYSRFFVAPEGLQIIDTLPQFDVISNQNGYAQLTWRYRIKDVQARLTVESSQSPALRWQPTVVIPPVNYSNDGFVLQGTTSIEKGTYPPILLDIITTRQQLQQALSKTPYDPNNPSHLAHRIWHTASPTDQSILMQQLMQLKLPNGAWGWVGSQVADPLITADVVIALTQSQQPVQAHQSALRYLQQQVQNPQLAPSIRALIAYALSLNQQYPITELLVLSQSPHVLGNEGLAALLLSMPAEYTYTIPSITAELLQRARSAPRGLWWAPDTATDSLHSQENVNALIYQALSQLNVATSERLQLGTQLLSIRGVNGWADSISNGRMWSQHRALLPTINSNSAITIVSDTGQIVHMGMMSPAQNITTDGLLQSDNAVLVGIARPRNPPTPTGEAVIWLQLYRDDGSLVTDKAMLTLGEEVSVRVSMAFFSSIPHVSITDPQSTLSTIITLPINASGVSLQSAPQAITLHDSVDAAKIIQYHYRIRLNHVGQSVIEPIEIRDGSGTLHAQSNAVMVYVVAP